MSVLQYDTPVFALHKDAMIRGVQYSILAVSRPSNDWKVFKRGGQLLLRLGDTDVPYSDEFRFFVTTKLANPHYMPEICIKVTIINFTVTMTGLEDQLLVDVVKNERPDLEAKKDELASHRSVSMESSLFPHCLLLAAVDVVVVSLWWWRWW